MKSKKIIIAIVIVVIAIVATVAIVQINNSKEPQTTTTTTEQTTENKETPTEETSTEKTQPQESATPLTEAEIKELFLDAHKLFVDWSSPVAKYLNVDWDKTTTIDGVEYFEVIPNEFSSVEELRKEYAKYFSEEIIKENIDRYYVMHDGKMYGNGVLVEGGEIPATKYELTVKSNTSTECNIIIASYIEDSKDELNYKLKVIDGKWKFVDVFHWVTQYEFVLE